MALRVTSNIWVLTNYYEGEVRSTLIYLKASSRNRVFALCIVQVAGTYLSSV